MGSGSGFGMSNTSSSGTNSSNSSGTSTTKSLANKQIKNQANANIGLAQRNSGQANDFLTGLLSNPYAAGNAANPASQAIRDTFAGAIANAKSGDAQSLGTARQGFMEGSALANAQNNLIGQGITASGGLLAGNNPNAAIATAANLAGTQTTGNQQQAGTQTGTASTMQGNLGCCFIFLESYNGKLPKCVRAVRDLCVNDQRNKGYRKQASWLVPLMQRYVVARKLTNLFMVKPLTTFGKWLVGESTFGWLAFPFCVGWFTYWNVTGKNVDWNNLPKEYQRGV